MPQQIMKRVKLADIGPNPIRDYRVDPIDPAVVEALTKSINQDDFWGGSVVRARPDGKFEVISGHHRLEAAKAAGITAAHLAVLPADTTDAECVRVYANENRLQRSASSYTAGAGMVAAAIRQIAKTVLLDVTVVGKFFPTTDQSVLNQWKSAFNSGNGIGARAVMQFLPSVHNLNHKYITDLLLNLRNSGQYARIIREVREEIERELEAARQAEIERQRELERLEKERVAREKAAKEEAERKRLQAEREAAEKAEAERLAVEQERQRKLQEAADNAARAQKEAEQRQNVFDLEGVAKIFKEDTHVNGFYRFVTSEAVKELLPRDKQAEFATEIKQRIEDDQRRFDEGEMHDEDGTRIRRPQLSEASILRHADQLLFNAENEALRSRELEDRERILRMKSVDKLNYHLKHFSASLRTLRAHGAEVARLLRNDRSLVNEAKQRNSLASEVHSAQNIVNTLYKDLK